MADQIQKISTHPNYKLIYFDIINKKYPDKKEYCLPILKKEILSGLDIITLNNIIFGHESVNSQMHRSYKMTDILQILNYQKKHKLNNTQLADRFHLSRNTIAKWKKIFYV